MSCPAAVTLRPGRTPDGSRRTARNPVASRAAAKPGRPIDRSATGGLLPRRRGMLGDPAARLFDSSRDNGPRRARVFCEVLDRAHRRRNRVAELAEHGVPGAAGSPAEVLAGAGTERVDCLASADGVSVPSGNASCATENTPLARAWARAAAPQSGGDGVVALPDGDPRIPIHSRRQRQRGRGRLGRQRPQQRLLEGEVVPDGVACCASPARCCSPWRCWPSGPARNAEPPGRPAAVAAKLLPSDGCCCRRPWPSSVSVISPYIRKVGHDEYPDNAGGTPPVCRSYMDRSRRSQSMGPQPVARRSRLPAPARNLVPDCRARHGPPGANRRPPPPQSKTPRLSGLTEKKAADNLGPTTLRPRQIWGWSSSGWSLHCSTRVDSSARPCCFSSP